MKSLRLLFLTAVLLFAGVSGVEAQKTGKNVPVNSAVDAPKVHPMDQRFDLWRLQMGPSARVDALIDQYKKRYAMLELGGTPPRATSSKAFVSAADFEQMVPFPGQAPGNGFQMPTVITAKNGDILAVVRTPGVSGDDFLAPPLVSPRLLFSRSTDDGLTWSDPVTIREDGGTITAFFFPELRETESGRLTIFDRHPFGQAVMSYSDDGGTTWQDGARNDDPGDRYHQPIDGKLWNTFADVSGSRFVFTTSDDALTWSSVTEIVPFNNDFGLDLASVAQSGSTIVALFFRFFNDLQDMATVTSTDGGLTWGPFVEVPFEAPVEAGSKSSAAALIPFDAKMKADAAGSLMIVAIADDFPVLSDVFLLSSSDAGSTWSTPSQFTLFAGPDFLGDVAFSNQGPLVFFGSDRFDRESSGVWYGLEGTTSDSEAPPFVDFTDLGNYPVVGPHATAFPVAYHVTAVSEIDNVSLVLEHGSMTDRVPMLDDGVDPDETAGDDVYTGTFPGLDFGPTVTYYGEATDANSNAVPGLKVPFDRIPITTAGDVILGVNLAGQFGDVNVQMPEPSGAVQWPGPGSPNFVSAGGLFLGVAGSPASVMHAFWDNISFETSGDWEPTPNIFPVESDDVSDSDFILEFTDSGAPNPIGLNVRNSTYQWSTGDETNAVILRYEIQNVSGADLEGVVASMFLDPDIYLEMYGALDDKVGWDSENAILYMYDGQVECNDPNSNPDGLPCSDAHVGIIILDDGTTGKRAAIAPQTVAKWTEEQDPQRIGTDDDQFYSLMTGGIDPALDLGVTPPADDYRILISPEALDIPAGQKADVAFAIVLGNSPDELVTNAAAVTAAYASAPVATEDVGPGEQPGEFELGQNYPNPFNPSTMIPFSINQAGPVTLTVSDVLGRSVAVLVNDTVPVGTHTASFEARDLPSGTYFYTLSAGGKVQTKTLFILK